MSAKNKHVWHDHQTYNTLGRHDTGIFLIAGSCQYAESADISRNRRKNENEVMLKIAHDKLNYKITYTETNEKFQVTGSEEL